MTDPQRTAGTGARARGPDRRRGDRRANKRDILMVPPILFYIGSIVFLGSAAWAVRRLGSILRRDKSDRSQGDQS